jgi:hypothetical protein
LATWLEVLAYLGHPSKRGGGGVVSTGLRGIQDFAHKLAQSGKFVGWRAIAFELRFEPGYKEAQQWLSDTETQEQLDRLCADARLRGRGGTSEAA